MINQEFTLTDKNTMREDIANIKFHMDRLNGETGELRDILKETNCLLEKNTMTTIEIKTDVDWLKRTYWIVATTAFGGLLTGILTLLFKQ
jgi:hypothetical protein